MFSKFRQAHTRNKQVYLLCRDQYYIEHTAQKDKPYFVTHAFGWHWYWDNLIKPQLTEFNNAYRGINLQRVRLHVTLTLKDFQIKDKHSTSVDNFFPMSPDLMYLWHYSYETSYSTIYVVIQTILINMH
jgi:hypothetical protein